MTVGDRIRIKREELKISQKELADRLKTTKQTIYKYEMNIVTNIPSDKIEEMARILEVSPSYLMGWESNSEIKNENYVSNGLKKVKNDFIISDLEKEIILKFRQLGSESQDMLLKMMGIEEKREESARMA